MASGQVAEPRCTASASAVSELATGMERPLLWLTVRSGSLAVCMVRAGAHSGARRVWATRLSAAAACINFIHDLVWGLVLVGGGTNVSC